MYGCLLITGKTVSVLGDFTQSMRSPSQRKEHLERLQQLDKMYIRTLHTWCIKIVGKWFSVTVM